ncbi:hypothetical protein KY284_020776 [Solanum tuberosum]|nr:hypothetical protein KY284_020776 [Solanum tuberosum]
MVSNGNQHDGGENRHNSGGVRHSGGGVQYISAIDEKKDESKPLTSLHKLTFYAVNLRLRALMQNMIFKFLMYLHFFTRIPSRNSMNINIEGLSITLLVIFYTYVRSIDVTLGVELRRPNYWA